MASSTRNFVPSRRICAPEVCLMSTRTLTSFRTKFARHLAQRVIASFAGGEHATELDRPPPAERPPDLSEAARDLLLEAAQDPAGVIMRLGSLGGKHRRTKQSGFVDFGKAPT